MDSNKIIAPVFNNDLRDMLAHRHTKYCECGGRGSTKSSFLSVAIALLLRTNRDFNALIIRKVADTLRDSVYEQMMWALDKLGMTDTWVGTVSPMKITNTKTGQQIIFRGADRPEKIKSIKLKTGYFAITWFEELTEFTEDDMTKIQLSTMRGGQTFYVFYSFNPPSSKRNWCNMYFMNNSDVLVHRTDYRTVPVSWLGDTFIHEAQEMKAHNLRAYKNIFLGEPTGTGSNVFENIELREVTDSEIDSFDYIYHAVDFGYFPDPFRYIAFAYKAGTKTLIIFDELSLLKHGNWEASEKLKELFSIRDYAFDSRIIGDSAEPKSIADFRQWGWNMRGAIKGKGSLEAGFKWLQSLNKIVCDPVRCPKTADELSLYEYEIDRKTGEILSGYPQNQPDHSLAALRYGTEEIWRHKGQ